MFKRRSLINNKLQQLNNSSIELSTNHLIPGIIKVFGCHISKGSNYKAVYVSSISTADEVVVSALNKYGLEVCNPKDYILCDVVGEFVDHGDENEKSKKEKVKGRNGNKYKSDDYSPWNAIYIRPITGTEKPLILQSLWKAADGKSRRFELRKRINLETSSFFINTSVSMGRSNSSESLFHRSDSSEEPIIDRVVKVDSTVHVEKYRAPLNEPFLLLLTGYDPLESLIYSLDKRITTVGYFNKQSGNQCDIILHSPTLSKVVASIYKKVRNIEHETNIDEAKLDVYIEPKENADVTVDGKMIFKETILISGQLISIGKHYLYIFKDPSEIPDMNSSLLWMETLKSAHLQPNSISSSEGDLITEFKNQSVQVNCDDHDVHRSCEERNTTPPKNSHASSVESSFFIQKSTVRLFYDFIVEDKLLDTIMGVREEELESFTNIPAYILLMAIEHSAANFTEIQTRRFLLKIASEMQKIAWDKTKGIGKQPLKDMSSHLLLKGLLSELEIVFLWMTNTLEMLHYLQCNLKSYLMPVNQIECNQTSVLYADEELLSTLEEVIMFTFQQTVYHLTKVLYITLPSVMKNEEDGEEEKQISVTHIVDVLAEIFETVKKLQVHPQMISQLFSYLFFFLNASLFNFLLERKLFKEIFSANGGIQLRQNFLLIEEWANLTNLHKEFMKYMEGFLSVIDILSKSSTELAGTDWTVFRKTYPLLKPSQLHFLLSEYRLNKELEVQGWCPSAEDAEDAYESNDLLENFATHPPLVLPSSQFDIDLCMSDQDIINHLSQFVQKLELKNINFVVNGMVAL